MSLPPATLQSRVLDEVLPVSRRINKELKCLVNESPVNYNAAPLNEEDLTLWQAVILGPDGSEYENGTFFLEVHFPTCYPFKPPRVRFLTPILHPNINERGALNLDVLKDHWSPALTISKILLSIYSLLTDPNPDDPLIPYLARLYKQDRKKYEAKVKQHTYEHAIVNHREIRFNNESYILPLKVYSLKRWCRRTIRNSTSSSSSHVNSGIKKLPLPSRIKNYLLCSDGLLEG